ncbi:MAG: hypothetical protein HeimC3_09330 [Candidatus Heimdallarchaeota archaeon LC_3]|nr:MAG: hypothetical protein HeimC3_09330 [Candidatus Heimdallarchaeota archaeon LC_3]
MLIIMPTEIDTLIYIAALISYIITLLLSYRLWFLIRKEKYWIGLPLATSAFAIHEFIEIYHLFFGFDFGIIPEILEMLGSFFLIYLTLGLTRIISNVSGYLNNKDDFD